MIAGALHLWIRLASSSNRREARNDVRDAVMRGHAIVKAPKLAQPVAFLTTELFDRLPAVPPTHQGADRQQDDIQ